jgi:cytochrome c peroxidase
MQRTPRAGWKAVAMAALAVAVGLFATTPARADSARLLDFTDTERRALLAHGPWPPPLAPDPSNRVSGNREAAALGQRLFFDGRLSANGRVGCVSCHMPPALFADGRKTSVGLETVDRNAPSLLDIRFARWFGRDGGADSLWAHALRPLTDSREHGIALDRLVELLANDAELSCRYEKVFGRKASSVDIDTAAADGAKAIAAFQVRLVSIPTPFDRFRDALAAGDRATAARYPEAAQRGARIFVGKGRCNVCHSGPLFSNREFGDVGIPFFVGPGKVDNGRHDGIVRVRQDRFNQLGRYNDDPVAATGIATRHVDLQPKNFGEWKIPGLRNVARTAPYMHNGSLATLTDVIRHYSNLDEDRLHADGERILEPLKLTDGEIADLVIFLQSLSSPPPGFAVDLLPTPLARTPCAAVAAK